MKGSSQKTPLSITIRNPEDYKNKYLTTKKVVGGDWFIENMDSRLPPIKRRRLNKK